MRWFKSKSKAPVDVGPKLHPDDPLLREEQDSPHNPSDSGAAPPPGRRSSSSPPDQRYRGTSPAHFSTAAADSQQEHSGVEGGSSSASKKEGPDGSAFFDAEEEPPSNELPDSPLSPRSSATTEGDHGIFRKSDFLKQQPPGPAGGARKSRASIFGRTNTTTVGDGGGAGAGHATAGMGSLAEDENIGEVAFRPKVLEKTVWDELREFNVTSTIKPEAKLEDEDKKLSLAKFNKAVPELLRNTISVGGGFGSCSLGRIQSGLHL